MTATTLTLNALFFAAAAALFVYAGRLVQARHREPSAARAGTLFAVWWYGLAGLAAMQVATSLLGASGVLTRWPYAAALHVGNILQVVALASLLYYVLYVYTGKQGWLWPLASFYAAVLVLVLYYIDAMIRSQDPLVAINAWSAGLDFDVSRADPMLLLLNTLLVVPQLGALIAYATIAIKAKERPQRYRVVVVASSLFLWLAASYIVAATGTGGAATWAIAARALAVGAAGAVIVAFRPPQRIQAWLDGSVPRLAAPREGMQARLRQLV